MYSLALKHTESISLISSPCSTFCNPPQIREPRKISLVGNFVLSLLIKGHVQQQSTLCSNRILNSAQLSASKSHHCTRETINNKRRLLSLLSLFVMIKMLFVTSVMKVLTVFKQKACMYVSAVVILSLAFSTLQWLK